MRKPSAVGNFDRRIAFQEKITERNEYGEQELTEWQDIDTLPEVWASIQERDGREAFESDRETAQASVIFTIRYRNDLNERMRIKYPIGSRANSQYYDILSIAHQGRKELTRIVAMRKDHEFEGENEIQ